MASLAFSSKYQGGVCYAACQELYNWFNPSTHHCRRGCDFATGRKETASDRAETKNMCYRYATELYKTTKFEMDKITDLRVHADMYPVDAASVYKTCLTGVRRQKY